MKFSIRKMTAAALSLVMAVTMGASAYADELDVQEHVQIHGYDCTVENGQYYTEIDGEWYLVINLDDFLPEYLKDSTAAYPERESLQLNTLASDHELYSDTVNLNRGEYISPAIDCNPSIGFKLKILNSFFSSTVMLRFHMNHRDSGWIPTIDIPLSFSALHTVQGFVAEYTSPYLIQCKVQFLKNGTTLASPFSYALYEY